LTKEYLYAFPFMAASLAMYRPSVLEKNWRLRLRQPALFALFVGALLILRKHMYAHPRDPHFRKAVILHKPFMFMYSNLASDVITANWGSIVLAALLIGFVCAAIYVRKHNVNLGWFGKIYVFIPASIALVFVALQVTTGSFFIPIIQSASISIMQLRFIEDVGLIFTIVVTIRNWNRGAMAAAWLLLFWSYLPVISFIGWHYAFPGGIFRAIYWAVWVQILAFQLVADFPKIPARLLSILMPAPVE
jgi:hypothetical protein